MHNTTMYCHSLHDKMLSEIKKVGYVPVGLGSSKFSKEWLKDDTLINISHKNKYYAEYTFFYWFWKNILPNVKDNHWIGFCSYRELWANKKKITEKYLFLHYFFLEQRLCKVYLSLLTLCCRVSVLLQQNLLHEYRILPLFLMQIPKL